MHVTKIKIKQDRVFVEYDKVVVVADQELLNKYSIDSPEQPVGDFKEAFQKMDFFLIELCELCDKPAEVPVMCEDVTITGLSFKYKDGGELSSAIITGTKALAYSISPLILNTPNKSICDGDNEFDKMQHLTDPCIAGLKAVIEHAKKYVDGERLQIEMDLKDDQLLKNDERPVRETVESKDSVSRETVKKSGDMAAEDWKLHPHNPDSPNFIGDAAIQQINDYVEDSDELEKPPV